MRLTLKNVVDVATDLVANVLAVALVVGAAHVTRGRVLADNVVVIAALGRGTAHFVGVLPDELGEMAGWPKAAVVEVKVDALLAPEVDPEARGGVPNTPPGQVFAMGAVLPERIHC